MVKKYKVERSKRKDNDMNNKGQVEKYWLVSITLLCAILLILLAILLFMPNIYLKGDKKIILSFGEEYKEKGYTATYFGHDLTSSVKISGRVNSNLLGKYNITYKVSNGFFTTTRKRSVIVSDFEKPVIDLYGGNTYYVCPGSEYKELGYKAEDNYDGNITKNVKVRRYRDNIVYTVRDYSHNLGKVSRKLVYKDIEKPTIKLVGSDVVYAFVKDNYEDLGYEVSDNCDDNVKNKVSVFGRVDTSRAGTYDITYEVVDNAGNKNKAKRTVIVAERGQNGTVYLTFDDGPRDGTTNVILDILRDNGIKATFFVTNNGPDELIKREYDEGHTVALHTATHDYSYLYSSPNAYFEDLYSVKDRVDRIIGGDNRIIRFPGGSSNTISRRYVPGLMSTLTEEVIKEGFHYFDWNLNSGDAGELNNPDEIVNHVTKNLSKDRVNIILMHDIKTYSRDALDRIIKFGKENGYVFDKITMDTEMMKQKVNN